MQTNHIIAIVLAMLAFIIIALVGFMTDILKEPANPALPNEPPYSFSRLQLFLWTLIIAPVFALHWGFTDTVTLNDTGLILLGISSSVMVTASVISGAQQSAQSNSPVPVTLKANRPSQKFWIDILMDDNGQLSLVRLQQLIFTVIYVTVYVASFFRGEMKDYPVFEANAYILMGISTGSYLLGKSLNK